MTFHNESGVQNQKTVKSVIHSVLEEESAGKS
jgi:hypothetical protein